MSSLTHGWSGLLLAYAAVEAPLAATLIRRGVETGRVIGSAALAIPLTIAAGIGTSALSPLLHGLGVVRGSFLELTVGVGLSAGVGYAAARFIGRARAPMSVHQRGTVIEDPEPSPARGVEAITLAGIPVAALDETKHFKLIGTTGTGKSTAIRELLGGALQRGDRAIIADPDGGYLARFKDTSRGDVVLNPFDPDSLRWDLFGEIESPYDIDQLARSLLPDQGGPDRSWISYARTFFTSVTRQAHEAGVTDIRELYNLLVVADTRELRGLLAGTPAQPFLEEHNGRMFDSIRSVTSSAVGSLEYIAQQTTGPLSIRRWVRGAAGPPVGAASGRGASDAGLSAGAASGRGASDADASAGASSNHGVLFIPYKAGQIAALRSTISAWMRLAIFEAMSQPEGDQRLWFVVDELDALGQIDGLKDALARLRKFGGRCVLGFQSIAQVSSTYGSGEAQTIVENCGNTLILRCSGSDHGGTANFASRLIGQREVLRTNRSRSRRPTDFVASTTLSEHVGIEPAVMDSQIEQLPDLAGYLKFASVPHWQRVTLPAPDERRGSSEGVQACSFWQQWRTSNRSAELSAFRSDSNSAKTPRRDNPVSRDGVDYE